LFSRPTGVSLSTFFFSIVSSQHHQKSVTELTSSAPGLVFWFADADAASQTKYPPTTFRWIDNQREAEEAVEAAKRRAARRASEAAEDEQ